jgi:hypothetical protein
MTIQRKPVRVHFAVAPLPDEGQQEEAPQSEIKAKASTSKKRSSFKHEDSRAVSKGLSSVS